METKIKITNMGTYIYTIVWLDLDTQDRELDPRIFFDLKKAIKYATENNNEEQHATIYKNVKDMGNGCYRTVGKVEY